MARLPAARRRPWSVTRACSGCRGDEGRQAAAPDAPLLGSTKVEGCSIIGEPRDSSEPPRTRWWSPIGSSRRSRLIYHTDSTACASFGCMIARRYAVQHHCASLHAGVCVHVGAAHLARRCPSASPPHTQFSAAWQCHLVPISLAARGGVGPSWAIPPYLHYAVCAHSVAAGRSGRWCAAPRCCWATIG